jgi:WD40 repeat protein
LVDSAAFMPGGDKVLVARDNGAIEARALPGGKLVAILSAPDGAGSVGVSPDGRLIAAWNADDGGLSEIRLWDAATLKPLGPIRVKGKTLYGVAFSSRGDLMAIGAGDEGLGVDDKKVVIWDLKTKGVRTILQGDACSPRWLAFSADGRILACASRQRWVDLWYDPDHFHRRSWGGVQGNSVEVRCLAFLPDDKPVLTETTMHSDITPQFVVGGDDNAIRVFQCRTHEEIQTVRGHRHRVRALVVLPTGHLVSGSDDYTMRLWDLKGAREMARLELDHMVACLGLSPDGQTIVLVESSVAQDRIRFWSVPALLRARGKIKPEECEKWRGLWKSAPAPGLRGAEKGAS